MNQEPIQHFRYNNIPKSIVYPSGFDLNRFKVYQTIQLQFLENEPNQRVRTSYGSLGLTLIEHKIEVSTYDQVGIKDLTRMEKRLPQKLGLLS